MKSEIQKANSSALTGNWTRIYCLEGVPGSIAWKATMLAITPATRCLFPLLFYICILFETVWCRKKWKFIQHGLVRCGIRTHAHKCGPETLSGVVLKSGAFDRSANLTWRFVLGVIFKTSIEGKHGKWSLHLGNSQNSFLLIYLFEWWMKNRFCGVMVSTLDFESKNPSSSLGRTFDIYVDPEHKDQFWKPAIFLI